MGYVTKVDVCNCLEKLASENLIGDDNNTYISLADALDRVEELQIITSTSDVKWISVENNLPELDPTQKDKRHQKSVRVICRCEQRSGKVLVKEGYYEMWGGHPCWKIPGSIDSVTHWMPLPSGEL